MPQVRLIRHAQSIANAGGATAEQATIGLSSRGLAQATALAQRIEPAPAQVICSPFLRARQTAAPLLARYRSISETIWPIQEFGYLGAARCIHTSAVQRAPWVAGYWQRCDPLAREAEDAESFVDFIGRVQQALARLASLPDASILVFGHGEFFKAIAWLLEQAPGLQLDAAAMRRFSDFARGLRIDNVGGFRLEHGATGWRRLPEP